MIANMEYVGTDPAGTIQGLTARTLEHRSVSATEQDGGLSRYLDEYKLYVVQDAAAVGAGGSLITNVVDKEYDFTFLSGTVFTCLLPTNHPNLPDLPALRHR